MSVKVLNRVLNYDHKVSSTEYLLDRLSKGYRELSLWDFTNYANLTVGHNSIRSWNRLMTRVEEYLPSTLEPEVYPPIEMGSAEYFDVIESDTNPSPNRNYCKFNNRIQYFYNLVEGIDIDEINNYCLMRKEFIYDSLCKLIYLNFDELEELYLALISDDVVSDNLAYKLNASFPNSVKDGRLASYFKNNLIGLYS